jgi:DNA-binding NarL/FixJ family response regulator
MTIRIEMDLDMEAYQAKYGPGSEWAEKYGTGLTDHMQQNPDWLKEAVEDVLNEGFYGEGRARAKLRGVRFGRKPALTEFQRTEAIARREAGETLMDIARSMNVSHSTISRL